MNNQTFVNVLVYKNGSLLENNLVTGNALTPQAGTRAEQLFHDKCEEYTGHAYYDTYTPEERSAHLEEGTFELDGVQVIITWPSEIIDSTL